MEVWKSCCGKRNEIRKARTVVVQFLPTNATMREVDQLCCRDKIFPVAGEHLGGGRIKIEVKKFFTIKNCSIKIFSFLVQLL